MVMYHAEVPQGFRLMQGTSAACSSGNRQSSALRHDDQLLSQYITFSGFC